MIARIILAVVVAVAVGLLLILLGSILITINVPIADTVGTFLKNYGWVIGILAGLWFFFTGRSSLIP